MAAPISMVGAGKGGRLMVSGRLVALCRPLIARATLLHRRTRRSFAGLWPTQLQRLVSPMLIFFVTPCYALPPAVTMARGVVICLNGRLTMLHAARVSVANSHVRCRTRCTGCTLPLMRLMLSFWPPLTARSPLARRSLPCFVAHASPEWASCHV